MTLRKSICSLLLLVLSGGLAFGTITINLELDQIKDPGGNPADALIILVADTGGDGIQSILIPGGVNVFDFVGENDNDQVIATGFTAISGVAQLAFPGINFGDYDTGFEASVAFGVFWINGFTPSGGGLTLFGGENYGFYTDPNGIDGSAPWFAPADGATVSLKFHTVDALFLGAGTNAAAFGITNLTVIPAPSTYLLMALGGVGLLFYTRRRS